MNLPTKKEWADSGFDVPDELCALPTPLQVMQPLLQQVECGYKPVRHVEPPIARQAHLQEMIRGLRRDSAMYKRLWEDTERLIVDYQVLAGDIPF